MASESIHADGTEEGVLVDVHHRDTLCKMERKRGLEVMTWWRIYPSYRIVMKIFTHIVQSSLPSLSHERCVTANYPRLAQFFLP